MFGSGLRIYFARGGGDPKSPAVADVGINTKQRIAGQVIAMGKAPAGEGAVEMDLGDRPVTLPSCTPESELFDDLNVMVAQRHTEPAQNVADWLQYHVTHHGLSGVVLLDRNAPGEAGEKFAEELATVCTGIPELKRCVLVNCSIPLGREGQAALQDPARAPRAKQRKAQPDPWLAPLNQPLVFDILKWRFLTRAGAVIALDPCDMLRAPSDGIPVFEACRQSHTGMMPVLGELSFPWRVRKGQSPHPGDHICRAKPPLDAPNRWAIAPKRAPADAVWLPGSITNMTALMDEVIHYDRAQSVFMPDAEIAELVNKDVLELAPALAKRARTVFDHAPVLPPERKMSRVEPVKTTPSGRTLIVTCMKNEGPFILEWLAYHRMIGVDDFLIYTNDCDDGTDRMLDALQERGLVQRRDNPFRQTGGKPQQSALAAAQSEPLVAQAGWIISMDVDEFINVHVGNQRLEDLYAAIGDADLISLTWRLFGNDDLHEYEDRPVTEQFTRCAPHLIRRPHQAWGFKTLFRNQGLFKNFGVHRPKNPQTNAIKWVNGSGQPMPERFLRTGWRSGIDSYGYDLVTLNHYSVRSVDSFLVKRDRGRVNHVARDQGEAYWFRMNNNDEQDLSIQSHVQGLKQEMENLKADPEIGKLHKAAVAAHRAKIAALRNDPEFAQLRESLTSDRMQKLSRLHRHLGMNVFLHGPSVIPDQVLDPKLDPGFFFNTAPPDGKAAD